jgi:hypothetical protein
MANKNADQLKAFYTELAKIAKSDDWQNILKVAKKSKKNKFIPLYRSNFIIILFKSWAYQSTIKKHFIVKSFV